MESGNGGNGGNIGGRFGRDGMRFGLNGKGMGWNMVHDIDTIEIHRYFVVNPQIFGRKVVNTIDV